MKTRKSLAAALVIFGCASIVPMVAGADPKEVRREMREGARSVGNERREAAHEIRQCKTRGCVMRETREGRHEVNRERAEALDEIRRERNDRYSPLAVGHSRDARHYHVDGRRRDSNDYGTHGGAHYHPGGKFCRDARHIVHLRDDYYRDHRRWYRDGRYWNEYDYVNRYYRRNRHHNHDGNDDLMRGIVIGAAVVGVIAAIHEANDGD